MNRMKGRLVGVTAKQAKKLKKGDKVVHKDFKYMVGKSEETTVEYVSFNPICGQYFIATMDGWGGYHKSVNLVDTV